MWCRTGRKCEQCGAFSTSGKVDRTVGQWYCTKCWDQWYSIQRWGRTTSATITVSVQTITTTKQMAVRVASTGATIDLKRTIHEKHGGPPPDGMQLLKDDSGKPGQPYDEDEDCSLASQGIADGTILHMSPQDQEKGKARREEREAEKEQKRRDAVERAELAGLQVDYFHDYFCAYFLCCNILCCCGCRQSNCPGAEGRNYTSRRQERAIELRKVPAIERTAPQREFLATTNKKAACGFLASTLFWVTIIDMMAGCILLGCGGHGNCMTLNAWHLTHCICDEDYAGADCTTRGYSKQEFATFSAANFSMWYEFSGSWRHTTKNKKLHSWFWTHTDNPSRYIAVKREGSTTTCDGVPVYLQAGGKGHALWHASNPWWLTLGGGNSSWFLGRASALGSCAGSTYAFRNMAAIPPDD
eukprot:COSAG02_NODE_11130_length_1786_cov_1.740368_2_plen_413_part_01